MALPIKPTPVLRGNQARLFEKQIQAAEQAPSDKNEYDRLLAVYRSVKIVDKRNISDEVHV